MKDIVVAILNVSLAILIVGVIFMSGCHENREYVDKVESGKILATYQAAGRYYTIVIEKEDGSRITSYKTAPGYVPVVGDKVVVRYFKYSGSSSNNGLASEIGR